MGSAARNGFTLIELLISFTLLVVVIGGVTMASQRGLALFESSALSTDVDARSARAIDRIVRELIGAGGTSFAPDLTTPPGNPTVWSSTLDFQAAEDWQAGAIVWSAPSRIVLELAEAELDNGVDDNGDGLVDERRVVLLRAFGQPDEQRVVLVNGVQELLEGETANGLDDDGNGLVDEAGLSFDTAQGSLTVRLSVMRAGRDGRGVVRTHRDSVTLRN